MQIKFCGGILWLHLICENMAGQRPRCGCPFLCFAPLNRLACTLSLQGPQSKGQEKHEAFSSVQSFQTPLDPIALWKG